MSAKKPDFADEKNTVSLVAYITVCPEALLILKEIDEFGKKKTVKEADENAIFCSKCGAKLKIGDNFCFKCGTKLPQA